MKELTIISGKGGSGKTSLVASFASLAKDAVLVDADVDAADLHLAIPHQIRRQADFKGGFEASIELDKCIGCGDCRRYCRFDAIDSNFVIDHTACEGCGVCNYFCPAEAIDFRQKICGKWFISDTDYGPMVHAKLGVMEENSGLLVSLLRKEAREIAESRQRKIIITDGAPGIGCPVISSLTGAHAALIVTEPTVSGIHDMKRVNELARSLTIPTMVCVNKYNINPDMSREIEAYAPSSQIKYLGAIPYDKDVIKAMIARQNPVEYSHGEAAAAIQKIWKEAEMFLSNIHDPIYYPKSNKSNETAMNHK